jgi:hypothetical protein
MGEVLASFPKQKFLDLIASGSTEPEALATLGYKSPTYVLLLTKNVEFREAVAEAKKHRADVWFNGIVDSARDSTISKEDVPVEKLKFEQRKYLAAIDNPDKYAERSKNAIDINLNIFQEMKDLPIAEAKKLLREADPFAQAVEVEFAEVESEDAPSAHPREDRATPDPGEPEEPHDETEKDHDEEDIFS